MPGVGLRSLAAAGMLLLLSSCSHPSFYADAERRFSTDRFFPSQGHFAVYYPDEIALGFPGYVVGIELSERSNVLRDGDLNIERIQHAGASITWLIDRFRDGTGTLGLSKEEDRTPIISHVLRYTARANDGDTCALYNVYQAPHGALTPFCDGVVRPRIADYSEYRSAFVDSWDAVDALKEAVDRDLASGEYTHLVVITLGWRTPQEEAIRSFRSLMRTVRKASDGDFRPLVIGVTWVGPWAGRWFDPLVETIAYLDIAHLADTLGLTWLGVLTDEVVLPVSAKVPSAFITHSFGSRAAATAVCVGPSIRRPGSPLRPRPAGAVDRLIGFQAAFSLQRFHEEQIHFLYEDIYFPNDCDHSRSIVLTTSEHDSATKVIVWSDLAGNYRYYHSFCSENADSLVSCTRVDESGEIEQPYDPGKKLLYLDASDLIRYRTPGTDGGAHSDIFRVQTGQLIWNLIADPPR